jgi:hypothetical protein
MSFAIKEMKIKIILRFHLIPLRGYKGKRNPHTMLVGIQIRAAPMEISIEVPQKMKNKTTI